MSWLTYMDRLVSGTDFGEILNMMVSWTWFSMSLVFKTADSR